MKLLQSSNDFAIQSEEYETSAEAYDAAITYTLNNIIAIKKIEDFDASNPNKIFNFFRNI